MYVLFVACLLSTFAYVHSAVRDSTDIIFNTNVVHSYRLDFYIDHWEDTLKANYLKGKVYMPARLTFGTTVLDSIGVRYKGNSSFLMTTTSKKPFKFKFDKYKKQTFYKLKKLDFSNLFKDPSFMRERIAWDIVRRYMPASRTSYAKLYVGDNLLGFYLQVEDVDTEYLKRNFANKNYNLYSVGDNGGSLEYLGSDQKLYDSTYQLETNEAVNNWSAFIAMLDKLNNTPDSTFVSIMRSYLNLDSCAAALAIDMVLSRFDSYTGSGRNYFLYDDSASGKFQIIPWDFNESFGGFTNNWPVLTQDLIKISNLTKRPLNRRIVGIESLRKKYLQYVQTLVYGPCATDSIAAMVDRIKPFIDPYVKEDTNKLYTYQDFLDNSDKDVYLGQIGTIPGLKSFSKSRNENLKFQLSQIGIAMPPHPSIGSRIFSLKQNPLGNSITISYLISQKNAQVRLKVYGADGRVVYDSFLGVRTCGRYETVWSPSIAATGLYIVALSVDKKTYTEKVILTK